MNIIEKQYKEHYGEIKTKKKNKYKKRNIKIKCNY